MTEVRIGRYLLAIRFSVKPAPIIRLERSLQRQEHQRIDSKCRGDVVNNVD